MDDEERRLRLEALFIDYGRDVLAYARRRIDVTTADDVSSEVFVIAWRRLEAIPAGDPLPWLFACARRVLANQRRGERRRAAVIERLQVEAAAVQDPVEPTDRGLARALASISERDREVGGSASATCLNGPSFTSTAANATQGGGVSQHTLGMRTAGPTARSSAPSVSVMGLGGPSSGPISEASQVHTSTRAGQRYTIVQGQVGAGVTRVTLVLSNGSKVRATVGGGSFIAWWPGSAAAGAARLATSSGATTQRLTFTPVPAPTPSPASAAHSTSSSP